MNPPSDPPTIQPPPAVEQIFYEALEKAPEARGAYLDHICAGDAALRREVEALLADHERARGFLNEEAVAASPTGTPNSEAVTEKPGTHIGPYKLLEQIGEGGFGTVWVAEQERPVRRRVALKVIKLGMDTREVLARFDQERQALALMDHPNIARMFDAGATPLGRPYFVMELVRGVKITEYCDTARLPTAQRLQLFMQVCHAVQHAHQKGVIHRDLKPSNILITLHDGVPVPKVIDFGVAKATREQRLTDLTVYTQFQQMIGTPAYMAPEQAEMSGLDVDTRSDIYSLGVLLYELLTGKTPFDHERLLRAGCDEMRRVLREEDPSKPSTFVSTMAVDLRTDIARRRSEEGGRLISLIRGDLDWIAMKALEKDRSRRYDTASSLAEDIGRHLTNEPVQARPHSAGYRFRRFARRNRGGLVAAAAVLIALLSGLSAATWMYLKEKEARQRAVTAELAQAAERQKAEQVARFLRDMLEGVKPEVAIGRDTRLLTDIVDRAATHAATELDGQPTIEAEVSLIIGEVYGSLGQSAKALPYVSRSLQLTEALHGKHSLKYAEVLQASGNLQDGEAAERQCRDALDMKIKLLGDNHPDVATSRACLAMKLRVQRRYPEAEALAREAVDVLRRTAGPDDRKLTFPLLVLAQAVGWQDRAVESEQLHRESLVLLRTHYGDNHPEVAERLLNLGQNLKQQKRLDEAEKALREGLQAAQRVLPVDHPTMQQLRSELIALLVAMGRGEEVQAANEAALDEANDQPQLGEDFPAIMAERLSLLEELSRNGPTSTALALARQTLVMSLDRNERRLRAITGLAEYIAGQSTVLINQGREDEALRLLEDTDSLLKGGHLEVLMIKLRLAEAYFRAGRHAEAEPIYRDVYERQRRSQPDGLEGVLRWMASLARVLTDWAWQDHRAGRDRAASLNRAREAEALLRECLAIRQSESVPNPDRIADVQSRLGGAIMVATVLDSDLDPSAREARLAEAEKLLVDGAKGLEVISSTSRDKYLLDAVERLVRLYDSRQKPVEAETWRKKLEQLKPP